MPTYINISAKGINRLNFGKSRISKIVGDNSQYEIILADNGSHLFITSKVEAKEVINATLLFANGEALDLRMVVSDNPVPAIININSTDKNIPENKEKQEIRDMINKMSLHHKGKYFVEEKKR